MFKNIFILQDVVDNKQGLVRSNLLDSMTAFDKIIQLLIIST